MSPGPRQPGMIEGIPLWQFGLRVCWIAVRLVLVMYIGQAGVRFFYQGF